MATFAFVAVLGVSAGAAGCANGQTAIGPLPAGGIHVLFIGNSLTYVNDLPGTLASLAASAGDTIRVRMVAGPNLALIDHVTGSTNAVSVIRAERWSYVVLQQGPSAQQLSRDTLILAARLLDPDIRAAGARSASYMVWPAHADLADFDDVRMSYLLAAQAVGGLFLPAGEAWRAAWAVDPTLPLYGADGFHPSELGTYLAALVM
ncbi:MAG: hypothetical protein ABI647_26285, partial [Gemmatimonadota bacterium]